MAAVVNPNFVCSTAAAHAIFEFITGDRVTNTCVHQEAAAVAARYALNYPNTDIIVDMRKLNARPKGDAFDTFWAKMSELVDGRVQDRRHGDKLYMPVATSIPNLLKMTIAALELQHAPKTLEESGINVPSLTWVTLQFCANNPLSSSDLNYTGDLKLVHKVQQRTLRATSTSSDYIAAAYKYMRHYAMWLHEQLLEADSDMVMISASCDDKCKVFSSLPIMMLFFC